MGDTPLHHTITIPEGTLTIEVVPGAYDDEANASVFLPRLKVHGSIHVRQTFNVEMRRELCRLTGDQSAADAVKRGFDVNADENGLYYWRYAVGTRFRDKAKTSSRQRPDSKTAPQLEAIADRECDTFHRSNPGWEQHSLRLHHIRQYQRACVEALRAQRHFEHLASVARQLRHDHHLTDAETVLEIPQ